MSSNTERDAPALTIHIDGVIAHLRLNRPEKRNAINIPVVEALRRFFNDPPEGVRAVVLSGEGAHFSAGLDLSDMQGQDTAGAMFHSRLWHRAFAAIEGADLPVVAVLRGAVIGGGLELAACAHIRVAEPSTFYALPEGTRGLFVGGGGSVRIPRLIGVARMTDMMLTGRTYGAADGAAIGLSQYTPGEGEGLALAVELATRIAGNTRLTNYAIMHALPRIAEAQPAAGYVMEGAISAVTASSPEAQQRLTDFLEKRAAKVRQG